MMLIRIGVFVGLFMLLQFSQASSVDVESLLQKSAALKEQRQYATAYHLLDSLDRGNRYTDIVLEKLDIALNFYVTSIMHQFFGFENLAPGQEIDSLRGKPGKYNLYIFKADEVLDSLLLHHPEDYRLHKALGDYYYEVYLRYGEEWLQSMEEVTIKIDQHYSKAAQYGVGDFETYFVLGFLRLGESKWQDAAGFLDKSIDLNPLYPAAYYNMAYALLQLNQVEDALSYGKAAWQLYKEDAMKADVARMLSVLFDEDMQVDSAVFYLKQGLKLAPDDYYLLKDYVDISVREQLPERDSIRLEFYLLAPDNPTIYNVLTDIYMAHEDSFEPLINFFQELLPVFIGQDKVAGNLQFFSGQLLFESNQERAKQMFMTAKAHFEKVFPADNGVFAIIDQYLNYKE
jgi:tetratricopeptide (TPR) repeat protein